MKRMHVLEAPLLVTDYDELSSLCVRWSQAPRCRLLEFVNTQIVTMRRHDAGFADVMSAYDELVPDGMPLVWCLNRAGAGMQDRVYGPTFMRRFLGSAPAGSTHFLIGGSTECGARLREVFLKENPGLRFVGAFHGRCGADGSLEGDAEVELLREINRLGPDFIWVGFGTPKQQAWARRHKSLLKRGLVLTVGFAFDANAGMKPDAPDWMQRVGLTWLYRMVSEPRRLLPRYVKWNSLFLLYLVWDGIRGRAWGTLR
jgi:N-acetylglucosaminyldiphosphoundecaprenol N-acetyl-beta-D-mannosaminyltransferase